MADNTVLNTGAGGDTIATDDVAGVKYQRVKLVDGTLDSATAIPGDATNGLDVDVTRVQGTVTVAGTVTANAGSGTLAVSNAGTFAVQDSQVLVDNAGFTDGTTKVFPAGYILDDTAGIALTENDVAAPRISTNRATVGVIEDGATRARYATVSASNALKVDGSAVTQPVSVAAVVHVDDNSGSLTVDNAGTFAVQVGPSTSGGLTIGPGSGAKLISAASTNATSVKASAGQVYGWYLSNASATVPVFVKLYNKASSPTVGTDVPVMTIMVPSGSAANVEYSQGIAFGTGIALAITGAVGDADSTSVAANETVVNLLFK